MPVLRAAGSELDDLLTVRVMIDPRQGAFYRCHCRRHGLFGPRAYASAFEGISPDSSDPISLALDEHEKFHSQAQA